MAAPLSTLTTTTTITDSEIETNLKLRLGSKWPLLYSVDVQTALMFLCTIWLSLLAPFPISGEENEQVNFVHDFVYGLLDQVQVHFDKSLKLLYIHVFLS